MIGVALSWNFHLIWFCLIFPVQVSYSPSQVLVFYSAKITTLHSGLQKPRLKLYGEIFQLWLGHFKTRLWDSNYLCLGRNVKLTTLSSSQTCASSPLKSLVIEFVIVTILDFWSKP